MGCDGFAVLKGLELIVAIICIILKRTTDDEAIHVFYRLEKLSKEWPLLNNVTWEENGSSFADITYGGFVIITAGLLIAYVAGELRGRRVMEIFFLFLGFVMFAIMGGLVLGALDLVPPTLVDNAGALGAMSLLGALLFLLDLLLLSRRPDRIVKRPPPSDADTQTSTVDLIPIEVENKVTQTNGFVRSGLADEKNHGGVITELRSSLKGSKSPTMGITNEKGVTPDLMKGQKGIQNGGFTMPDGTGNGYQQGVNTLSGQQQESFVGNGYYQQQGVNSRNGYQERVGIEQQGVNSRNGYQERVGIEQQGVKSRNGYQERVGIGNGYQESVGIGNGYVQKGQKGFEVVGPPSFEHISTKYHPETTKYSEKTEMPVSHNLDKFKKRRARRAEYSSGESDYDDFLHLPTVSFLLADRDEQRRKKEAARLDERPGTRGTPMLPMIPVTRSGQQEMRRSQSIENLIRKEDLERERRELENQREQLAREREKYLFNSRKHKEEMAVKEYDRKTSYSASPDFTDGYYRTPALTPDFAVQRKKSVTIKDVKDPNLDEVQEKLSQQGFRKVDSDPVKRKVVGFSNEYPEYPDDKYKDRKHPDNTGHMYAKSQKKSSMTDLDVRAAATPTPDYERMKDHWRYDSRDANASRQSPEDRSKPSTPMDPGFVLHAASIWPEITPKTPSQSPSEKAGLTRTSSEEDYHRPTFDPPLGEPPRVPKSQRAGKGSQFKVETPRREEVDDIPSGGSLTTQLLQKWLKQRNSKVMKVAP